MKVDIAAGRVRLVSPVEPLAWAVGIENDGVFHTTWHSERVPGTKSQAAKLEAPLPRRGKFSVRVYCDDGGVGMWTGSHDAKSEKRSSASNPDGAEGVAS